MANFAAAATQIGGNALIRTASAIAINQATGFISRAFDNRNFEGPRLGQFSSANQPRRRAHAACFRAGASRGAGDLGQPYP